MRSTVFCGGILCLKVKPGLVASCPMRRTRPKMLLIFSNTELKMQFDTFEKEPPTRASSGGVNAGVRTGCANTSLQLQPAMMVNWNGFLRSPVNFWLWQVTQLPSGIREPARRPCGFPPWGCRLRPTSHQRQVCSGNKAASSRAGPGRPQTRARK